MTTRKTPAKKTTPRKTTPARKKTEAAPASDFIPKNPVYDKTWVRTKAIEYALKINEQAIACAHMGVEVDKMNMLDPTETSFNAPKKTSEIISDESFMHRIWFFERYLNGESMKKLIGDFLEDASSQKE